MRILITGFSGFVSYHFLNYLNSVSKDFKTDVLGLDICEPLDFSLWRFDNLNTQFLTCQLTDKYSISKAVQNFKPTHILHLAALSSVGQSWKDPAGCFTNNTAIFLNLVESVREFVPKCRLLCIGSSEEYGNISTEALPLKESQFIQPASPYAVAKMAQESMGKCYVNKFGMNIIFTRSFNHIGPRQRDTFVIASFVKQVAQAVIDCKAELPIVVGNMAVKRDFIDVRDVVRAYFLLLETGRCGEIYNVCSGSSYALNSILDNLSAITGIKITTVVNKDLFRPNDTQEICGDNSKINSDTGWKPEISIIQSLTDILEYWKFQLQKFF